MGESRAESHGGGFGFKDLTVENYLKPDEVMEAFVTVEPDQRVRPITPDEWTAEILKVCLVRAAPPEVRELFLVARGAMLYGYFFYPLYALATEQLLRLAETGVSIKCKELGAQDSARTFRSKIEWLKSQGIISQEEAGAWHALRGLRNSASHPRYQMLLPPGPALTMLQRVAANVSKLFEQPSTPTGAA